MNGFSFEFTHTECLAGGTLLYIGNYLSNKTCSDLNIYKSNELESNFIEILNLKKSKITIGCFYEHHSMDHYKNTNDLKNISIKYLKNKITIIIILLMSSLILLPFTTISTNFPL